MGGREGGREGGRMECDRQLRGERETEKRERETKAKKREKNKPGEKAEEGDRRRGDGGEEGAQT